MNVNFYVVRDETEFHIPFWVKVDDYNEDEEELKEMKKDELERLLDDLQDTSDLHPNKILEEFMEHENWD